jgi:hypothetical protein
MSSKQPRAQPANIPHKPECKVSSTEVTAATQVPALPPRTGSSQSSNVLLTPKEAVRYLRVSLSWLAKARMRGDGPAYVKVGRSVRYTEAALHHWMKSRQRMSTSEQ